MSLEFAFRLGTYLTLGLACACLGYAELAFLPEIAVCAGVVGGLLVVAFLLDGRRKHLSIAASNWLGGGIAAVAVVWAASQFLRPRGGPIATLPWPAGLLPYLGPLLMILIPAKLFRPKFIGDYWGLQGIGLIAVALGCALANDATFGVLLLLYLLSGTWTMTLFYLYRVRLTTADGGRADPPPEPALAPPLHGRSPLPARSRLPLATLSARWLLVALGLALGLFLAMPRSGLGRWELADARGRMEVGYPDGGDIDLNHTGWLVPNHEPALEVWVEDAAGRLKTDLDLARQRWRGTSLQLYGKGTWQSQNVSNHSPGARRGEWRGGRGFPWRGEDPLVPRGLVDLGPSQYFLTFTLLGRPGKNFFLADPVYLDPASGEGRSRSFFGPVISLESSGRSPVWRRSFDGTVEPIDALPVGRPAYKQVALPVRDPDRRGPILVPRELLGPLSNLPQEWDLDDRGQRERDDFRKWTAELLRNLIDQRLPPEQREPIRRLLDDQLNPAPLATQYEAIARAFRDHLALSGAYGYSLQLRRENRDLDPVLDFLYHTRRGHCERFASALALMLRARKVPAQVVIGFRGGVQIEPGRYLVRQENAHAWVEVLVPRPSNRPDEPEQWDWLSLDPTPAAEPDEEPPSLLLQWLAAARASTQDTFHRFIVEYDTGRQDRAQNALLSRLNAVWLALGAAGRELSPAGVAIVVGSGLLLLAGGLTLWQRHRRRRAARAGTDSDRPGQGIYARLLAALARRGHRPAVGQTAREFAAAVGPNLALRLAAAGLAAVPAEAVEVHYRVRFGGAALRPDEERSVSEQLDRLDAALRK